MASKPIKLVGLTPIQRQYLADESRFILLTPGRRARKTLLSMRKVLYNALSRPNTEYFHAAPTYDQAVAIFWDNRMCNIKSSTESFWLKEPSESEHKVYLANGSTICIQSMDRPWRVEGRQWHGFHITECPNIRNLKKIWEGNLMPVLSDTKGFAILDGVPDAYSDSFVDYKDLVRLFAGQNPIEPELGKGIRLSADKDHAWYGWLSADVLDAEEIAMFEKVYDPLMFAQEFKGSFVSMSGLTYYGFIDQPYPVGNIDNSVKFDPSLPVFIGIDFNVNPMTAVLCHHIVNQKTGIKETHAFAGLYLPNSNTDQLANKICIEYGTAPYYVVIPCQSSHARQTVADIGTTDQTIIESVFREHGKTVFVNKSAKNPLIKDRVNLANARLHNKLIRVNGNDEGIKELIKDWASITFKPGTANLDLKDEKRGHISAALDYCEFHHFDLAFMGNKGKDSSRSNPALI